MSMAVFSLSDPAANYAAVTPTDTAATTFPLTRGLYVGTPGATGTLVAVDALGNEVTFTGLPAGAILPIRCVRVKATGTTASDIVRLW